MQRVVKSVAVIAAGAGLAFLLAAAAFYAAFASFGHPLVDWEPVEGTRLVLVVVAVLLVHLLWIVTWCVSRRLGWARFVAAALLVPVAGLLGWLATMAAWQVSTRGNGWSWGSEVLTQEPTGWMPIFVPAILVPAMVVAGAMLVTVLVPRRDPRESMLVRPARMPQTLLRGFAITAAVLGSAVLAALLVFLLLALSGRV